MECTRSVCKKAVSSSVRLSVKRVDCDRTKESFVHWFLHHVKERLSYFSNTKNDWWETTPCTGRPTWNSEMLVFFLRQLSYLLYFTAVQYRKRRYTSLILWLCDCDCSPSSCSHRALSCGCVKADSQAEMDSWIDAVHLSCAASYARHLGRDGTAKLLRAEIHKLENSIDLVCCM